VQKITSLLLEIKEIMVHSFFTHIPDRFVSLRIQLGAGYLGSINNLLTTKRESQSPGESSPALEKILMHSTLISINCEYQLHLHHPLWLNQSSNFHHFSSAVKPQHQHLQIVRCTTRIPLRIKFRNLSER
jgi:hypothetical protein